MFIYTFPTRSIQILVWHGKQNNGTKDVHVLMYRAYEYVTIRSKRELILQMELHLLLSRPWDGESVMDYPGGAM